MNTAANPLGGTGISALDPLRHRVEADPTRTLVNVGIAGPSRVLTFVTEDPEQCQ